MGASDEHSGSSGSSSYSAWYQTSPGWSSSGSRGTEGSLPPAAGGSGARGELAKQIPRRPRVSWWGGLLLALGFAVVVTPPITAEHWLPAAGIGPVRSGESAKVTVRVPPFAGVQTPERRIGGGGLIVARGAEVTDAQRDAAALVAAERPRGGFPYAALFALVFVFAALFTHHVRRTTRGRLLRVQLVSLATVAGLALAVKVTMLATPLSILVVPVALLAMVPTMALDRVVGLATGVLAALITSLLVPFDVTVAILLLVQAATAGLVIAERPKQRFRAALIAGLVTTLLTPATLLLIAYLTRSQLPELRDPARTPWIAAAIGPAIAMLLAVPVLPLYQLLVGEITHGKLVELEDLSHPLLRQIAERAPGTWQHSLMMANMAEIAANAIGASGRLVRVGAYFHDLGKSLTPKYFIENLEPGETSPHDQVPPEVSCNAIFAHVTEGIVVARRSGLHERIVDFMHMHHGNGVLEYFWGKAQEQGNPRGLTLDQFRYPGHPPQSRETAILAICDAVEAASRTLKKPEPAAIDALVQRIVYGKLHLGQLDESGLSMEDLRRINDSLRETIRHANHGRIEYPWQKAQQDASASVAGDSGAQPRLDSLDRRPRRETAVRSPLPPVEIIEDAVAETAPAPSRRPAADTDLGMLETAPQQPLAETAPEAPPQAVPPQAVVETAPQKPAVGEHTQVGRAPAPERGTGMAPQRAPHETQRGRPPTPATRPQPQAPTSPDGGRPPSGELAAPRAQGTQLGFGQPGPPPAPGASGAEGRTRPPPPPGARPAPPDLGIHAVPTQPPFPAITVGPTSLSDELATPVMPAMLGERVRAESRAESEPDPEAARPTMPLPPPTTLPGHRPPATRLPPVIADAAKPRAEDWTGGAAPSEPRREDSHVGKLPRPDLADAIDESRITAERLPHRGVGDRRGRYLIEDAASTEPSLPRFELPLLPPGATLAASAPAPASATAPPAGKPWSSGLAARVEAAMQDEWSNETPVVAPTKAELRALLGAPDPTRQQSLDELEALHRAVEDLPSEPELLVPPARRGPYPTSEVDPDQIEAAIELAPPARRGPNTIVAGKLKKPE